MPPSPTSLGLPVLMISLSPSASFRHTLCIIQPISLRKLLIPILILPVPPVIKLSVTLWSRIILSPTSVLQPPVLTLGIRLVGQFDSPDLPWRIAAPGAGAMDGWCSNACRAAGTALALSIAFPRVLHVSRLPGFLLPPTAFCSIGLSVMVFGITQTAAFNFFGSRLRLASVISNRLVITTARSPVTMLTALIPTSPGLGWYQLIMIIISTATMSPPTILPRSTGTTTIIKLAAVATVATLIRSTVGSCTALITRAIISLMRPILSRTETIVSLATSSGPSAAIILTATIPTSPVQASTVIVVSTSPVVFSAPLVNYSVLSGVTVTATVRCGLRSAQPRPLRR
mmetsp:Transcript_19631/g.49067  ORF Transcript_19631/g.49067 Transcript_19631/m.49067 type:complete len:343 (+) Transcript_19631:242-1270(+)